MAVDLEERMTRYAHGYVTSMTQLCTQSPNCVRQNPMEQKFEPLNPDDIADLEAKRAWVRDHYDEAARHKYETLDGKLRLLDTILRNKWIAPDETLNLQCLGVTFGDALAHRLSLTWVAVENNLGRDLALVLDGTSVRVFPNHLDLETYRAW
jgi:uncharacterized protein DUF3806